jgi:hypothetical protein
MSLFSDLLAVLTKTTDRTALEGAADAVAESTRDAIRVLLSRLGDPQVHDDDDVHDAICSALVELGIMIKLGNGNFLFRKQDQLTLTVIDILSSPECRHIQRMYFTAPPDPHAAGRAGREEGLLGALERTNADFVFDLQNMNRMLERVPLAA